MQRLLLCYWKRVFAITSAFSWQNSGSKEMLHDSQYMEATQISIDRWRPKEDVAHKCNGTLLNHKKEQIWVSCSEGGDPRACHTEWKSEREKQTSYTVLMNYLQRRNGDTDEENRPVDTAWKGEARTNWESSIDIYILMLSHFSSVQPFATPWTIAFQAPVSIGFPRREYWSGLPYV